MSDPNQPPQYPGPEQPADPQAYPPPPPAYPPPPPPQYPTQPPAYPPAYGEQPPPPPGYGQQYPPPPYGQQPYGQQPQYGVPQYPQDPYGQAYASPPPNPYVHWGLRVAAYLLNYVLLLPGYILGAVGEAMADDPTLTTDTQNVGLALALVGYLGVIAFWIWNEIVRQGRTGSSLGKQWVGIAVVSEQTGTPIGGWRTLGRALLHILDALSCFLGYLWPLWDDKRQTFADKIMKTIVVKRVPLPPQAPAYPAPPQY